MIELTTIDKAKFVTHAGQFHADDVMATVLLEHLYPHQTLMITRVNELNENTELFAYDIGMGTYDHHQSDKAIRDNDIHYSSVGLIWRDFGHQILRNDHVDESIIDSVWADLDDFLFLPIDALDNGEGMRISASLTTILQDFNPPWHEDDGGDQAFLQSVELAELFYECVLKEIVLEQDEHYSFDWDEGYDRLEAMMESVILELAEEAGCFIYEDEEDAIGLWDIYGQDIMKSHQCHHQFLQEAMIKIDRAMIKPMSFDRPNTKKVMGVPFEWLLMYIDLFYEDLMSKVFKNALIRLIDSEVSRIEGRQYVEECISQSDGAILVLDRFVPWRALLKDSTQDKAATIMMCVYPSQRNGWNWQAVPLTIGNFEETIDVPDAWKGLRDDALQEECGIKDALFTHPDGFIGGAASKDGAIEMAQKAIDAYLIDHPEIKNIRLMRT